EWSRFNDPVWVLSRKRSIYWSRLPKQSAAIDQDAFERLVSPLKSVAYFLLTEEALRPATTYYLIYSLKEFAAWLLSRPIPTRRYDSVTESVLDEYFDYLSKRKNLNPKRRNMTNKVKILSTDSLRRKALAIAKLFHYRDRLEDGLQ